MNLGAGCVFLELNARLKLIALTRGNYKPLEKPFFSNENSPKHLSNYFLKLSKISFKATRGLTVGSFHPFFEAPQS